MDEKEKKSASGSDNNSDMNKTDKAKTKKNEDGAKMLSKEIAKQFEQIHDEFSQFGSVEELPDEIISQAVDEKISLFDAILRYLYREYKRRVAERENQMKNMSASARFKKYGDDEDEGTVGAMLKGVYGK